MFNSHSVQRESEGESDRERDRERELVCLVCGVLGRVICHLGRTLESVDKPQIFFTNCKKNWLILLLLASEYCTVGLVGYQRQLSVVQFGGGKVSQSNRHP